LFLGIEPSDIELRELSAKVAIAAGIVSRDGTRLAVGTETGVISLFDLSKASLHDGGAVALR
jgi:hypothetical protein